MKWVFLVSFLLTCFSVLGNPRSPAQEFPKDEWCWQKEIDPQTKKPFNNMRQWEIEKSSWSRVQKPFLNPILLIRAFKIYQKEKSASLQLGNDKTAHCYVGCKIAQGAHFKTARYVGWLKEDFDLSDCKIGTHFEPEDYVVTVLGARWGSQYPQNSCAQFCLQHYP